MAGKSRRSRLVVTAEQLQRLRSIGQSAKAPAREVLRANILLRYDAGESVAQIARSLNTTRKSVAKWVNRALSAGTDAALKDAYHRPKEPVITEEGRAWVIHLACSKPKDLGHAAELWTRSA
jgi:transposase